MDEIRGTLQYFTGNQLTLLSGSDNYVFDISQATLECADGMLCGDAVSVIYEGSLTVRIQVLSACSKLLTTIMILPK